MKVPGRDEFTALSELQLEVGREDRSAVSLRWPGVLGAHGWQRYSLASHQGGSQEEGRALKSPSGGRAFLAAGTGVSPNLGVPGGPGLIWAMPRGLEPWGGSGAVEKVRASSWVPDTELGEELGLRK